MSRKCFDLTNKKRLFALALAGAMVFAACGGKQEPQDAKVTGAAEITETADASYIDYAGQLKLDMNSETVKQEATVKSYVDGDTTHFYVPDSVVAGGVLKARYIAINTPESTGKIEEWGKKASNFTKDTLSKAVSIILESDSAEWNVDSTGGRYLVWVWYKTAEDAEYRNLNIEILQNGLAIASSSANNRYGSTAVAALSNAKACKRNLYSGQKDPDFFYGDALELDLKELRTHLEEYNGSKVAFEGVITKNSSNSVYVEEYDEETAQYYGIMVYYGFGLSGEGLDILSVGNRSRIVGSVQYYENGGTYQISGLTYRQMKPDDPGNIRKLGEGYSGAYVEITADELLHGKVTIATEEQPVEYDYAFLALDTTVSMKNLRVTEVYTTTKEDSASFGAMTLTCESEGNVVTVRTEVLYDGEKNVITSDAYLGKTIDVRGIVAIYNGSYQIKVMTAEDITVQD